MLLRFICEQKTFLSFLFFLFLFLHGFFRTLGPTYLYIYFSCCEQCCLFEYPSLAIILKHSFRFINSICYPMGDPSHPFMSVLITLVLKRDPLHILDTNTFSLKHSHPFTSINPFIMTSVKSQGSSHCKGKEVASDDPTTRDVGKEVLLFESEHFNEEEARCDPDSECAPLINLWYNIHAHFLKVLSEYMPLLPLGRVWLALCHRNMDISWALLAYLTPNLVICQGTLLLVPILFEFGTGTALGWKE